MRWEIEANIGCCSNCPKKVDKYLRGVKGVESVDLYPDENKVVVMGDADPGILLLEVQKVRKKARMLTKGTSAENFSAIDEYGCDSKKDNSKKKIKPADAAQDIPHSMAPFAHPFRPPPLEEEASEKAIAYNEPPKPSDGGDKVASESKTIGLNLMVPGLFGAGVSYSCGKTYKG